MQGAPVRLRCQYQEDPLGIDGLPPRLSWWSGDHRPAERQTAYHLLAASQPELLARETGDLWDTGRVEGGEASQIEYRGAALLSRQRVYWKVRSFDSDGLPSPWSDVAVFEVGLLNPSDWEGRWIRAGLTGSRISTVPVPLFGRTFDLPGDVARARLYLAARGLPAVQLNGRPLLEGALAPGWVDYRRRAEYVTVDVTGMLTPGPNHLAVLLADGWYAGDPGNGYRQFYGDRPELLMQLEVTLADGSDWRLVTDSGWRWQPSWILAADPGRGEQTDGARSRDPWLGDGPATPGWYPVVPGDRPEDAGLALSAAPQAAVPGEKALPGELVYWHAEPSHALFELPEPVLGRARLAVDSPPQGVVRLRYGHALEPGGRLQALGEDVWAGAGQMAGETLAARFSLHGFRYVEVSGDIGREDTLRLQGVPIRPAQPAAATLVTDHPQLNTLFDLLMGHLQRTESVVTMAGLLPEDRAGWVAGTGGAMTARMLALDGVRLVCRWLRTMADAQLPEGGFPAMVPPLPGVASASAEGPAGSSAAFVDTLWQL